MEKGNLMRESSRVKNVSVIASERFALLSSELKDSLKSLNFI